MEMHTFQEVEKLQCYFTAEAGLGSGLPRLLMYFILSPPSLPAIPSSNVTGSLDLLSGARRLRLGVPCSLADEHHCHGGSHRVFEVLFEDSVR
jgi:hypothetical protein